MLSVMKAKLLLGFALILISVSATEITVQMDKPGVAVSPMLYGAVQKYSLEMSKISLQKCILCVT